MPLRIIEDASLRGVNTFGVEARARRLVDVEAVADLPAAAALVAPEACRLVLGGGSNVLFSRDFEGTVLRLRTAGRRVLADHRDHVLVEAEAGEPWDDFVRWTLGLGLCGLENLTLIPGSVGASPIQNIGAYGVEIRDRFAGLTAISLVNGSQRDFAPDECAFGYRDSVFKRAEAGRWIVTRVRLRLDTEPRLLLDYGEIRDELRRTGCMVPTPGDVADAVAAIRRRKLPDPAVLGNAGSFFKNPIVDRVRAQTLLASQPGLPHWNTDQGVKLSAAWMIERCGWKGKREGDAGVHASHALVLVNHGKATGAEIVALADRIRDSVWQAYGVRLEPEPMIV